MILLELQKNLKLQMLQNGTLKLTVTTGEIIIDKEGNQIVAIKDEQIDIEDGSIVTLAQVKDGKVEFISNENSDTDGSFKFQVGDGVLLGLCLSTLTLYFFTNEILILIFIIFNTVFNLYMIRNWNIYRDVEVTNKQIN